jgi:hypothetical protein
VVQAAAHDIDLGKECGERSNGGGFACASLSENQYTADAGIDSCNG